MELSERVARIEGKIDTIATKEDLAKLEANFRDWINEQTWKFIKWVTGVGIALVAASFFIARNVQPPAPPAVPTAYPAHIAAPVAPPPATLPPTSTP